MVSVRIIQIDTRIPRDNFDYQYPSDIAKWSEITQKFLRQNRMPSHYELTRNFHVKTLRDEYEYVVIDPSEAKDRHIMWIKYAGILKEFDKEWDILIVLDTDAWIKDYKAMKRRLLDRFIADPAKHFIFAEEPDCEEGRQSGIHQALNAGFLCLKHTDFAFRCIQRLWDMADKLTNLKTMWPRDQGCLNLLYANSNEFRNAVTIAPLAWCNTPAGSIVRHCWIKEFIPAIIAGDMMCIEKKGNHKVLFYCPPIQRSALMTYDNYIEKGGFSGSETAILEFAKRFADLDFEVAVCAPGYQSTFTDSHGITYLSPRDIQMGTYRCDDVEIFFPLYCCLDAIPVQVYAQMKGLVIPCAHCQLPEDHLRYMQTIPSQVLLTGPSLYSLTNVKQRNLVVANGINPSLLPEMMASELERKGRWIFHASFSRGGQMCGKIFSKTRSKNSEAAASLEYMSYYLPDVTKVPENEGCRFLGSLDKRSLFRTLATSDYFVYPLINSENASVHHDTYACCVLEALACGMIVVTWDVACLREVYGDHLLYVPHIPYPGYEPFGIDMSQRNPEMLSPTAEDLFVKAILDLESTPGKKSEMRTRASNWARQQTWDMSFKRLLEEAVPS